MRYCATDERDAIANPAPEELERILRTKPHSYWQQGGNGEAVLGIGPGHPDLWIKQPEPAMFFVTYAAPLHDWLVPFSGGSCDELVKDERGGDPFWIPRACLIEVDTAVAVVRDFLSHQKPSPAVAWCYWHKLPLPDSYPRP